MSGPKMKRGAVMALMLALGALAGCGNDASQLATGTLLRGAATQVVSGVTGRLGGAETATPDPAAAAQAEAQLASAALQSLPGPVMLGTLPSMGGTTALGLVGQNGARRSYQTPTDQMIVTEGGLVIATRGLGHDLQSAETGALGGLIRNARAGQGRRVMRYLDGEWVERPLTLDCEVTPQGSVALGAGISARKVVETCRSGALEVENSYLLRGGRIIASEQWIGPMVGAIELKVLRD